ncbi:hypothetical protein Q0Z83_022400 [Actinoplanes sichuanensis]|nr:hypothetical protein Q0Z83_022400 [Actinoplanes sichuanensis]
MAQALVTLAETPDDMPEIGDRLQVVARLAAHRIGIVTYAAITPRPDDGSSTVATSPDLVEAIDDATPDLPGEPAPHVEPGPAADGLAATIEWPGFRDTAAGMGMGVVSVPLFTGSGTTVATLDLYGPDPATMAPIAAGIRAAYDPDLPWPDGSEDGSTSDPGVDELVEGVAEALSTRSTIQLALDMIRIGTAPGATDAYLTLRLLAADDSVSLLDAATTLIAGRP